MLGMGDQEDICDMYTIGQYALNSFWKIAVTVMLFIHTHESQ